MRRSGTFLAAALLAGGIQLAQADSALLEPVRDNSMYEENGSLSNGSGIHLFSGNTSTLDARRALIRFDVAAALPPRAVVTSASVTLTCTQSPAGGITPHAFSLHRATADWGEAGSNAGEPGGLGAPAQTGDATWSDRFFGMGQPWATAGGDFDAGGSASDVVGVCSFVAPAPLALASTPQLVADVQAWLDDPGSNFGWVLVGNEGAPVTARRFASRESTANRPVLSIEYEVPPPAVPALSAWGAALLCLLLLGLSARRRFAR